MHHVGSTCIQGGVLWRAGTVRLTFFKKRWQQQLHNPAIVQQRGACLDTGPNVNALAKSRPCLKAHACSHPLPYLAIFNSAWWQGLTHRSPCHPNQKTLAWGSRHDTFNGVCSLCLAAAAIQRPLAWTTQVISGLCNWKQPALMRRGWDTALLFTWIDLNSVYVLWLNSDRANLCRFTQKPDQLCYFLIHRRGLLSPGNYRLTVTDDCINGFWTLNTLRKLGKRCLCSKWSRSPRGAFALCFEKACKIKTKQNNKTTVRILRHAFIAPLFYHCVVNHCAMLPFVFQLLHLHF